MPAATSAPVAISQATTKPSTKRQSILAMSIHPTLFDHWLAVS